MVKRPSKLERRRRILAAAHKVFVRRGFGAARMADVAAEAQVGKGTLYEYFRSKEDLFSTLVVSVARDSLEGMTSPAGEDPVETLRHAVAYMLEVAVGQNLDLYRLFFDFWGMAATHRTEAQARLREVEGAFRRHIGELVRRGQREAVFSADLDAGQYAHALSAAIDGVALKLIVLGVDVDLREYGKALQALFVDGILAEPALGGASVLRERNQK